MSEGLKAQRHKVLFKLEYPRGGQAEDLLRELQKQAMEAAIRRAAAVKIKNFCSAEIDWLLDEPPPHSPPRCIHCGRHEGEHRVGAHAFKAQSPRCHRAHPHQEPCA